MSLAPAFMAPARRLARRDVTGFMLRLMPGATVLRCAVNEYAPEVVGELFTVTSITEQSIHLLDNDHGRRVARMPRALYDFDIATPTTLGYRINGSYKIVWENVPFS